VTRSYLAFRFGTTIDEGVNARVHAAARALRQVAIPGVREIVPAYVGLAVEYDPRRASAATIEAVARASLEHGEGDDGGAVTEVATVYDGADLEEVARRTGLTPAGVASIHAGRTYRVFALGFTPGFAFMASVDPRIRLPRRAVPRLLVPPNALAMANEQTGVYPIASPGGWHLIGRTLSAPYDPWRSEPFLFTPGGRVRFVPAHGSTPAAPKVRPLLPVTPRLAALEVLRPGVRDLVVDAGRVGSAHLGLARGGPLDPRALREANQHVGNADAAAGLEMALSGPRCRVLRDTVIGVGGSALRVLVDGRERDTSRPIALRRGAELRFEPTGAEVLSYLALPGGIEGIVWGGSVGVDVRASLGRPLERGDVLGQRSHAPSRSGLRVVARQERWPERVTVRLLAGPQATREALEVLDGATFQVSAADRMGVRLEGPEVPGGELISEPTELGAVQVTTGGAPIVLLNDRGSLGGYAKPAIVHPDDLATLAQLPVGASIRTRVMWDADPIYQAVALD